MRRLISSGLLFTVAAASLFGCDSKSKDTAPAVLTPAPKDPPIGAKGKGATGMPGDKGTKGPDGSGATQQ